MGIFTKNLLKTLNCSSQKLKRQVAVYFRKIKNNQEIFIICFQLLSLKLVLGIGINISNELEMLFGFEFHLFTFGFKNYEK